MLGPNMTVDKFRKVLAPKVDGALALHNALKSHKLDFFVMTSSISAIVGQPGQCNYAAANSFLDGLAWQRNLEGLPASSLVLPMVLGVGVVAENEHLENKITRSGMYGVDEREMLRGFETAMSMPVPKRGAAVAYTNSAIIMGLDPTRLAAALDTAGKNSDIGWVEDARFSELKTIIAAAGGATKKSGSGGADGLAEQIKAAFAATRGYDAVLEMTAKSIMQKCGGILLIDVDDFEMDGPSIGDYGLDSMIGTELRNWLFKTFGFNIAFRDLLAPTLTFKGLSQLVLKGFGI